MEAGKAWIFKFPRTEDAAERLRREVLPAVAHGKATFWQGYSEPGAGSDLLSLTTEARSLIARAGKFDGDNEGQVAAIEDVEGRLEGERTVFRQRGRRVDSPERISASIAERDLERTVDRLRLRP